MAFLVGNMAVLSVLSIFYCWKRYSRHRLVRRRCTLRERITYLLWIAAQHNDDNPSNPKYCSKLI